MLLLVTMMMMKPKTAESTTKRNYVKFRASATNLCVVVTVLVSSVENICITDSS